ncbi:hypothetical protein [Loigolactobacillus bifermentans]|nr:hypothetical protein [Loigolactobacillus bifermentans]QGG61326.1 hypothetical protein LB003_13085 [Loigolactobacillus bifermentans]
MGIFDSHKKKDAWRFPSGKGLTLNGINAAGIDTFSDVPVDSITREGIQNSLDARDSAANGPVVVSFSASTIASAAIPGITQLKSKTLPAIRDKWASSETAMAFFDTYESVIEAETVPVLKISDFNTKGLAEKNWQSLIFVAGDSVKDDEASAGSKGIGKFAPFAASNLRMVFYHTISENEGERSIGVSQLVSYDTKTAGEVTQGPAYFSAGLSGSQYQPMQDTVPFKIDRKVSQFGTDLFVVGFKNDTDWQDLIKMSVLSNFLISIWTGELEVQIEDEIINRDRLPILFAYFKKIEKENKGKRNAFKVTEDFKDAFRAFQVLTNSDLKQLALPGEMVETYDFIDSAQDAHLLLALLEDTNRKILQTRKSGMKINYKNHISGSINFFGVFQATGQKLNKFLKDIENASHDDWYVDRIVDRKKKATARQFLKDLTRFYKTAVNDTFAIKNTVEMDAFQLDGVLIANGEQQAATEDRSANLEQKVANLKIKKYTQIARTN